MKQLPSLLVAFLACSLPALAEPALPSSIPLTTNPDATLTIPATLGSDTQIRVMLDTGAGIDIFAPSLIAKVHGRPAGQFTGFRMFGERLDAPLYVLPRLAVGPVVKQDVVVAGWELLDKMHLDGIVAVRDLRGQPFTLDLPGRQLTFESTATLARRAAAGKAVPLQMDDVRGTYLDLFAQFSIAGKPGQCEIDTGSQAATINSRYMALLGIDKDSPAVQKKARKAVETGADITRYWTTIPELALADAPAVRMTKPRLSFADIIYDCVVGIDFWQGRVVTFDIPAQRLIIAAP